MVKMYNIMGNRKYSQMCWNKSHFKVSSKSAFANLLVLLNDIFLSSYTIQSVNKAFPSYPYSGSINSSSNSRMSVVYVGAFFELAG